MHDLSVRDPRIGHARMRESENQPRSHLDTDREPELDRIGHPDPAAHAAADTRTDARADTPAERPTEQHARTDDRPDACCGIERAGTPWQPYRA
jgi:hypothetical protein